jgi:hypothetical protein
LQGVFHPRIQYPEKTQRRAPVDNREGATKPEHANAEGTTKLINHERQIQTDQP